LLALALSLRGPEVPATQGADLFPLSVASNTPPPRVVVVSDPEATETFRARDEVVKAMVDRALTNLTGKLTVAEAWRSLVSTQDTVGIKVYSMPGPYSGTRPAVVAAVVQGLLVAGVPPKQILVWDRDLSDLRAAGFQELADKYGVRLAASADAGYDEKVFYDTALIGNLVAGDLEFGRKGPGIGRKSYVSKLVTGEMTRIIVLSPLLNHNQAGVAGILYSLTLGSVDNCVRFESDPARLATAVPEIYALPILSDRVAIGIVDALICQYEGNERGLLHYSAILNELRFSHDPVALDRLSLEELNRQRQAAHAPAGYNNWQLYTNAALLELGVNDLKKIQVDHLR
jgi:hypothetical protein